MSPFKKSYDVNSPERWNKSTFNKIPLILQLSDCKTGFWACVQTCRLNICKSLPDISSIRVSAELVHVLTATPSVNEHTCNMSHAKEGGGIGKTKVEGEVLNDH